MEVKNKFGRIGVLMGGPSSEREISLKSGRAVYEALKQFGLEVVAIDIKTDKIEENVRLIKSHQINCAFLALHGRFGEDGQIQEVLENIEMPYTGSGPLASKLAMDKVASRRIFEANGLHVPRYDVLEKAFYNSSRKILNSLALPIVVKPATHGSSVGLTVVDRQEDLGKAVAEAFEFDERILLEEYINGREVTVGILDERALPVIEIIPKRRFFDYEAKYHDGMTEYIVPAHLEEAVAAQIQSDALSAHKLLGCLGCSRVDMILNKDNIAYILEVNSIPGFTEMSLLPKAARAKGIEFAQLCFELIKLAYEKTSARLTS